jgi:ComF family protein
LQQIFRWAWSLGARKLAGMFGSPDGIVNQWRGLKLTAARGLSRLLGATLFPPQCSLCGFEGTPPDLDLCSFCRAELPWDREVSSGVFAALRFEPPADELIRQLKYANALPHARVLGVLLAQSVAAQGGRLPRLLVPVPLHDARLRERGFNQALAIARVAAQQLGVPFLARALRRRRDTPSQTGLDRHQRRANVRDAFGVSSARARERLLAAAHVAVVDDVCTTGSTLAETKSVLLAAGVARVDQWAVARVAGAATT